MNVVIMERFILMFFKPSEETRKQSKCVIEMRNGTDQSDLYTRCVIYHVYSFIKMPHCQYPFIRWQSTKEA